MQINSTFGIGATNGVKVLVYGRAGRGKTTLCATAPSPFIISAEGGLLSLSRWQLPYVEIRAMADLYDAFRWCSSSAEAKQFQTICLDSISEIAEVVLGVNKAKTKDGRAAYGDTNDQMMKLIREFRDLPHRHVYMSAKQEFTKNEATGVMVNMPSMPGKTLTKELPYFFDEVFQLDVDPVGNFRFLRTQPDFMNDAKDRSGMLDPVEQPDLGKIIAKITQGHQ